MKDLFSSQSKVYAAFRPIYPAALYEFIFKHIPERNSAWDCATGNGQVAHHLASHFKEVYATDISQQQLDHAIRKKNIHYSKEPAEKTDFKGNQFDLITVAQALHWFDRERFYNETRRVSRPDSIVAVWGYGLLYIDDAIDKLIMDFYENEVGPYWDDARKLVEEGYRTIDFPFAEIKAPPLAIKVSWTLDQLAGYFSSWSATQKYVKERGHDPVPPFIKTLRNHWPSTQMTVTFPIFMRIGRVQK